MTRVATRPARVEETYMKGPTIFIQRPEIWVTLVDDMGEVHERPHWALPYRKEWQDGA